MSTASDTIMRFSVSDWEHLYSLEQAIVRTRQANGKRLNIRGTLRNEPVLDNRDTPVRISFVEVDDHPAWHEQDGQRIVLGQMQRNDEGLTTELPVDARVFEEMRRNLMEYADVDGIHIMVTIGLDLPANGWPGDRPADIVKLDYAMRGDA